MFKRTNRWAIALVIFVIGLSVGIILTAGFNFTPKGEATPAESELVLSDGHSIFAPVVKEVQPTVVNISAEKVIQIEPPSFSFPPFDDFFKRFFQFELPHPYKKRVSTLGSGFIFMKKGDYYYILTNNHVVRDADKIIVTLLNGDVYRGDKVKLVGKDARTDIAVVRIKADKELPVAKLGDSDSVEVGDWAIAIGNPFGLTGTVTVGVISAKGRSNIPLPEGPDYQDFIQTDAAINFGNSGGPLVNIKGEVIGINTAIQTPTGGFIGIGFAIPINTAKFVAQQLIEKGKVVRGYLGVKIQEVTADIAEAYGLERPMGALIAEVQEGYPAAKAGLKSGDLIIKFNGKDVQNVSDLRLMVASTPPGTKVEIEVIRPDGTHKTFKVKLTEFPEEKTVAEGRKPSEESEAPEEEEAEWMGITVRPNPDGEGVVVTNVDPESDAYEKLIPGDIILKVGQIDIKKFDDFQKAKKRYKKSKRPVVFYIDRRGAKLFIAIRPE